MNDIKKELLPGIILKDANWVPGEVAVFAYNAEKGFKQLFSAISDAQSCKQAIDIYLNSIPYQSLMWLTDLFYWVPSKRFNWFY